jgi:hypothetical protein
MALINVLQNKRIKQSSIKCLKSILICIIPYNFPAI